ncbi:bifunctional glycogen debranching protein GlgX/4-alpha-glucanotransferase [Desulfosporosinus sp.]|uniref:bifunctional glycogen debranching protein GlgX/4-alpha-glucanotransferase n=1 Tax=Desulfosporosinus sp. TaxID=157907 RepID=UPI002311B6CB|nr:bifunctional glycogen debranching protein GlgX/4-alpha-glucanotransferase [Desulfosporosinus sp.]MDA8221298.1 bifunctional glycogen debranching protein GlgX/4-alpha-glucanotransferase [Desulfitobacterium hafniense]
MEFMAYHNSHDFYYRDPFGSVNCGQKITFRISALSPVPIDACVLRLWETDREITNLMHQTTKKRSHNAASSEQRSFEVAEKGESYEAEYAVPNTPGLIWYYFVIYAGSHIYYYGNNNKRLGGIGSLWEQEPPAYQITVHKQTVVPEWYKRGVMYQIFIDRFFNPHEKGFICDPRKNTLLHADWSDQPVYIKDEQGRVTDWDFFGGTLQGVIEKLPYFQELGISILYFNPIFEASSNHKYDTADYHKIDPMYGDDLVFKRLIDTARHCGISIILDGVFSHTGSDSIYFNKYGNYPEVGAYQSVDSLYYNWYKFKKDRQEYESWWGVDSLPEVNEMNSSYRQFLYGSENSVVQKWLKVGVAGWRLDVADELPDEFIQELRQAIKSINPNAVLIGEVWEDASNKISYDSPRQYFLGDELDAAMNYPFRNSLLSFMLGQSDAKDVYQEIMSLYENYPRENFYAAMNLIGSHDTIRVLTLLGNAPPEKSLMNTEQRTFRLSPPARRLAVQRLKLLSLLQMTFPGVPCIYYGDEAGVEGYADPYNRGTYPWGREDREINDWYGRILRMRAEFEVLQTGQFEPFYFEPDVYGFSRAGNEEEIVILINRHRDELKLVDLSPKLSSAPFIIDLINGERLTYETLSAVPINALSGRALYIKKNRPHDLQLQRSCGVLLHISSLPSSWGLGDLGQEAYDFVDFLAESGQSIWQVLPLNPAGAGDCPYQSDSVFAGNSVFISLDHLINEGLLDLKETRRKYEQLINIGLRESLLNQALKELKQNLLYEAYQKFSERLESSRANSSISLSSEYLSYKYSEYLSQENYVKFLAKHKDWLQDYVLFRALKDHFGGAPWFEWESKIASRETEALFNYSLLLQKERDFNEFLHYTFFYEWNKLKTYAEGKGIKIMGDLPHFVAADSCDVWVNRSLFILDEKGRPAKTAGVPPDYFSKTGQLWGNPVYDWKAHATSQYSWWKMRIYFALDQFNYIRLDHFRGFEAFWEVDAEEETAERGRWIKGPGKRFFESMFEEFGKCPFIVEDLGIITTEVNVLKQMFSFPGIKVLQFTPPKELLLDVMGPETNFVYYTGTHDNNTLIGWCERNSLAEEEGQVRITSSQQAISQEVREDCRQLIEELYLSQAVWVILPMQDILELGDEARMNVPGTVHGNWKWQLDKNVDLDEIKDWLLTQAEKAKRLQI